jgi:hypothetical protein
LCPAGKLRPIAEQLARLSAEERTVYRLPEDALGAIHFRAIERIYGDSVRETEKEKGKNRKKSKRKCA